MYQLTDDDKAVVKNVGKALNMRLETFDDTSTDTLVDVNGTHTVDRSFDGTFIVCQVSVRYGVRYHSDGSGTPDEVDVEEIAIYPRFIEALAEAVSFAARDAVYNIQESTLEDLDMAREEARLRGDE